MKILLATLLIPILLWAQSAQQQALIAQTAGAAAYSGPGDVQAFTNFWSLRAYTSATRGTKSLNVCIPADATCADLSTDATTGNLTVGTIGGSSCAVVTCTAKTIYDKAGSVDLTQATIANRAVLTANCINTSLWCLVFTRASSQTFSNTAITAVNQPFLTFYVAQRTGNTSSNQNTIDCGGASQTGFRNTTNNTLVFAGTVTGSAANDNAWHAVTATLNGASSESYVDGSGTTVNAGAGQCTGLSIGGPDNFLDGKFVEGGFLNNTLSSGVKSSLNTNAHNYWGF